MKNIVIVGGGTAGWITALTAKKFYPTDNVTLIESDDIGILGAGEGTTGGFLTWLYSVDINPMELIEHCKATVKVGINFQNWNGDGKSYFHFFFANQGLNEYDIHKGLIVAKQVADNKSLDDINFCSKLSKNKRICLTPKNSLEGLSTNSLDAFDQHATWSMHFDARALAVYLRKVATMRGVNRVEGIVKSLSTDERNYITGINLENGQSVACDFVFDCTGFARLIIGKHYNTAWKSYSDRLPMNKAIPFFIDHDNNVKPETGAIAMKYGWVWHIPVQGRYGCGYVFDSNYVNDDQALAEVQEYFKQDLVSPRSFSFSPGGFKETVVNNCMAVGLSQSFVEPLEATSIWITILNLKEFITYNLINNDSPVLKRKFNKLCNDRNDEIVEFLHMHYWTKRNDSKFWQEFKEKHPLSDIEKEILEEIHNLNNYLDVNYLGRSLFGNLSYIAICHGLGALDIANFNRPALANASMAEVEKFKKMLTNNQQHVLNGCISHKDFIQYKR